MEKFPIVKCPYCFEELKYNNAVFRCNTGEEKIDDYLKTYHCENGNTAFEKRDFDYVDPAFLKKSQLVIDKNGRIVGVQNPDSSMRQPLQQRLCPYCHNKLLKSFGKHKARYIAVVGVPNSGKTTFLAAVNASLRSKSWNWGSLDSDASKPLDIVTEKYSYNQMDARVATKEIQGPYFYHLSCPNGANKGFDSEQHIVFFDIPGEFYLNADRINGSLASFLSKADGIVFVVNSAEYKEKQENIKGDQYNPVSINGILDAFEQTGVASNKKVAIIFNKLDKIKDDIYIRDMEEFVPQNTDYSIDTNEVKQKSDSIISLMLGEGGIVQNPIQRSLNSYIRKIQQVFGLDNTCIFATRLLVEHENGFYFRPEGAETPFLWLLSEIGAFPNT